MVYADDIPLAATLLAGREVFFFTGELRRSSAEATAESLRELGADEIRTFCLRKGSDGPDTFRRMLWGAWRESSRGAQWPQGGCAGPG